MTEAQATRLMKKLEKQTGEGHKVVHLGCGVYGVCKRYEMVSVPH